MARDIDIIKNLVDYYSLKIILGLREEAMIRKNIKDKLDIPQNQISERMRTLENLELIYVAGFDRSARVRRKKYKSNITKFTLSIEDELLKLNITYHIKEKIQNISVPINEFLKQKHH